MAQYTIESILSSPAKNTINQPPQMLDASPISTPKRAPTPLEPYIRKSVKKSAAGKTTQRTRNQSRCEDYGDNEDARIRINSRERRRMHDLNSAVDNLRECLTYGSTSPSARKLSKCATLILAREHIIRMNQTIIELQREKLLLEMRLAQTQSLQLHAFNFPEPQKCGTSKDAMGKLTIYRDETAPMFKHEALN